MTNYKVGTFASGLKYDDLLGGESVKVMRANVRLAGNEAVERGELISRGSDGYFRATTGSDSHKMIAISAMDSGSDENRVINAYYTGLFNRSKIKAGSDVNMEEMEVTMREQGIYLTDIDEFAEWKPINYGSETGSEVGSEEGSDIGSDLEGSDS